MKSLFAVIGVSLVAAGSASAQLSDGFETYADGSTIAGQGGWELWYSGGSDGVVTNDQAHCGGQSLQIGLASDVVQQFSIDEGKWTFKVWTFVPSGGTESGYVILMNQYGGAQDNWSLQVEFNQLDSFVESEFGAEQLPLVTDAWALLEAHIDLDNDLLDIYYDGQVLAEGLIWTDNVSVGGITSIACLDLYSPGIDPMYFDDVSLRPQCAGDFNADGSLNVFDFLEFQSAFGDGAHSADFNGDCNQNVFDFLSFQTAFGDGC